MKCNDVRERLMEVKPGSGLDAHPEVASHVEACDGCAKVWTALQGAFALMDEWQAPPVSPFFETRLRARLAEVKAEEAQPQGFFAFLRKPLMGMPMWRPVLAGVLLISTAAGVGVYQHTLDQEANIT